MNDLKGGLMEIGEFWSLVHRSRQETSSCEAQAQWLEASLVGLGKEEIIGFENNLLKQVSLLQTFDHLAAHFMIESYTSDDTFRDFQSWLVMQGQERFEQAQKDPSTIADWLTPEAVESIDGSGFVTLSSSAYEEAGGDEDEFYDRVEFCDDPDFEMPWPDDKEGFEARWPKLCARFWNQERIDALHA